MGNIDIRDLRDGKFLWIDKAALNLVSAKAGNRGVSVYSWLCYYANAKNQNCYPSLRTLALHCNVSRRTIMRTIKTLEKIEIVSIERKKGRRNVYKLLNSPVDKSSDTAVTGDTGGTGVVTPMSLPLVTPVSPKQELIDQDKKNKTNVCLSAELWITLDLPYAHPGREQVAELVSWCERLAGDVDLYRLLERYRKDKGYPPMPKVVITLCKQFMQDKARVKNAWGWFKKAIDGQMKQVLMDMRLQEHERLKKEPAKIGQLLSNIIPRRE
ncbi:MAG: helix-turn-helix domain-containing protein [Candidatus Omnitrophica bacterium]|nr:helix-turn-helix domain-containing protein [Candidatus Omnitrophota bacterium]